MVFSKGETNGKILLQIMEWLIYHSIEIIILILCVIGWKFGGEIHENPCQYRFPNHHNIIHNGDLFIQLHKEDFVMDRLKECKNP